MRIRCLLIAALTMFTLAATAMAEDDEEAHGLALIAVTEALGRGSEGTVVGVVAQIAPEDRDRVGERVRVVLTLVDDGDIVDRHAAVVLLEDDGSVMLYREWPVGSHELQVTLTSLDGDSTGVWIGDIHVPEATEAFVAPDGAAPDAVALAISPPDRSGVRFLPPPNIGGIGALQLEVEAPETTRSVEFFHEDKTLGRRNRPPWTVSVPLGDIIRRTTVRAVAVDAQGNFLGEDAVVLNSPTGQIGIQLLLAPEETIRDGKRKVTVSVTGAEDIEQVTLSVDAEMVARWVECPCVAEVDVATLARATILSADVTDHEGNRGDMVMTLEGGIGFVGTVRVELVELPIVVLDANDVPVVGLTLDDFKVYEDGEDVQACLLYTSDAADELT